MHFKQGFYFFEIKLVMSMLTKSMSHIKVDFVSYIDSKSADLKKKNCERTDRRFDTTQKFTNK